jgi:hypothetical protein
MYGAVAFKRIGFPWTADILAITGLSFAIIYFIIADGYSALKKMDEPKRSSK